MNANITYIDICDILRIPSERKMCFPQHEHNNSSNVDTIENMYMVYGV